MEENTPQIIRTIGESGEEILMKLIEIVCVDGKDYALMSLVDENILPNSDSEDEEIIIMRMNKTENECTFEIIEDDAEFSSVAQAIADADELEEE